MGAVTGHCQFEPYQWGFYNRYTTDTAHKSSSPGRFGPFIFFYQAAANLNTAIVQCHQWQTEKSISVTGRKREGARAMEWYSSPHLPVRSPADGSAASERSTSRNRVKMVQDTRCLKITTAATGLRRITGCLSSTLNVGALSTQTRQNLPYGPHRLMIQSGAHRRCGCCMGASFESSFMQMVSTAVTF